MIEMSSNNQDILELDSLSKLDLLNESCDIQDFVNPRVEDGYLLFEHKKDPMTYRLHGNWDDEVKEEIREWLSQNNEFFNLLSLNRFVYGKNTLENIVSIESNEGYIEIFRETENGISSEFVEYKPWMLSSTQMGQNSIKLKGNLHYKWLRYFDTKKEIYDNKYQRQYQDFFHIANDKEAAMVLNGYTYYKGMKINDVSILSFDIEATTLAHNEDAKVLVISNTYRKGNKKVKTLFRYDEYETQGQMLNAWCQWVSEINPSILCGHNIFGYDLPYMEFIARREDTSLFLGRYGRDLRWDKKPSKFRKDGSQSYNYLRCHAYGREIVDTMFVAYHYDVGRKYVSYALKKIIEHEGLIKENRQFYDASLIGKNYTNPEEFKKIVEYCADDSDDSLALYDLMIPAFFYFTQSIPKSFQVINYSATGSQLNSFLLRSYLQDGHSIPKATDKEKFEGAISFSVPSILKNVMKLDVSSLYPSIIREYEINDYVKDPKENFLRMVNHFTLERLVNKKKAKETGDRYYTDLEQSQKIAINSAYGLLGANGLNFNSSKNAALVCNKGREILSFAIMWATGKTLEYWLNLFNEKTGVEERYEDKDDIPKGLKCHDFILGPCDTDSISICKKDMSPFSTEEQRKLLDELNNLMPSLISWDHDGIFPSVVSLKAKNYVLKDEKGKVKIKGSALKSSKTEKALKEMTDKIVYCFLDDKQDEILNIYHKYIKEIHNIKDISRWTSKKTFTEKVLSSERANETKLRDILDLETTQLGDKIYVYFDKEGNLKKQENWTDDHCRVRMMKKVYNILVIFKNILDLTPFVKYHNKKSKCLLDDLLKENSH